MEENQAEFIPAARTDVTSPIEQVLFGSSPTIEGKRFNSKAFLEGIKDQSLKEASLKVVFGRNKNLSPENTYMVRQKFAKERITGSLVFLDQDFLLDVHKADLKPYIKLAPMNPKTRQITPIWEVGLVTDDGQETNSMLDNLRLAHDFEKYFTLEKTEDGYHLSLKLTE